MTAVAIIPDNTEAGALFRASSNGLQSVGRSVGEALDLLASQLGAANGGTLVVIQTFTGDDYFPERDRTRLAQLFQRWRSARDRGEELSKPDQLELEQLTKAEQEASLQRIQTMRGKIQP